MVLALGCAQCGSSGSPAGDTDTDTDASSSSSSSTSTGDAESSSTGPVELCGNGEMEGDEECDDGNTVNGDDCTADCMNGQQLAWVDTHDQGNGTDCAEGIAVDGEGNVIVAGFVLTGNQGENIWVRKYSPGGEVLWTETVDGPGGGDDRARGVAANAAGEIVVTGFVSGNGMQGRNLWVRGYDAGGGAMWTDPVDGPMGGDDQGYGVAATDDGWVVSGEIFVGVNDTDMWLRRYDAAGAEVWTQMHAGQAEALDSGRDVDVGPSGEIVVTGWETDKADGRTAWTRKYDATGAAQWTARYNGGSPNGNQGNGVAVGADGSVTVAGTSRVGSDPTLYWNQGYDADGNEVWTKFVGEFTTSPAIGRGAAAGQDGQFSTVGSSTDQGAAAAKIRLVRYDATGDQLWQQGFTGPEQTEGEGFAVAIGPDESIAFAGCDFTLGANDSGNIFVAKITP